jgi:integrase
MKKPTPRARNHAGVARWYASKNRFVCQATRNGKIVKTIYGALGDKSSAQKLIVEAKIKPYLDLPEQVDATRTVKDACDAYIAKRKPATRARYKAVVRLYIEPVIGSKRMLDVRPAHIEATLDAIQPTRTIKSRKPPSMDRSRLMVYKLLQKIFTMAVRRGEIVHNPVEAIDAPTYERIEKQRVYTPEEQRYLLAAEAKAGGRYLGLLSLMLSMPLRTCEAIAIRRLDLNFGARRIHICNDLLSNAETDWRPVLGPVKTTASDRFVFLTDETAAHLTKAILDGKMTAESFLFTAPRGGLIDHAKLSARWWHPLVAAAAQEAEKDARERGDEDYRFPADVGLHGLRHTAIENLKAAGVPLDVIHTLAGHSNLSTTMKHYNQPTLDRRLAAADQVGSWLQSQRIAVPVTAP